jgi:hypothetical protein
MVTTRLGFLNSPLTTRVETAVGTQYRSSTPATRAAVLSGAWYPGTGDPHSSTYSCGDRAPVGGWRGRRFGAGFVS